jgi:hypothetical protein
VVIIGGLPGSEVALRREKTLFLGLFAPVQMFHSVKGMDHHSAEPGSKDRGIRFIFAGCQGYGIQIRDLVVGYREGVRLLYYARFVQKGQS